MRIALATAIAAFGHDIDMPPLQAAFARAGVAAEVLAWDDPTVAWSRFDAVLLRSTWDYTQRLPDFLAWCERVAAQTRLFNPPDVVRWNTDKHYLADLAARGVPVVPSSYIDRPEAIAPTLAAQKHEYVLKPCVGAGSRDAARFLPTQIDAATTHAQRLLAQGQQVLLQPYLGKVDGYGETALIHIAGRYTHAIRKGPLLPPGGASSDALFAAEDIQPRIASEPEHAVAAKVMAALPSVPLYARVDLLPGPSGPLLLELEMVEPSLFFDGCDDAADRLVAALVELLDD